ncbi:hypothetical protein [Frisingicoccus sp.]
MIMSKDKDRRCGQVAEFFRLFLKKTGDWCVVRSEQFGYIVLSYYLNGRFVDNNVFDNTKDLFDFLLDHWQFRWLYRTAKKNGTEEYECVCFAPPFYEIALTKYRELYNIEYIKYMGEQNMKDLIREPLMENIKNNLEFYIMCCIPVFPFCLSADFFMYLYLEHSWNMGNGFGNCLLLIASVLLLVCFAVFRYTLKGYIRKKAEKYNLLLILGISSRDFWKILAKEYCAAFLLLIITFALGSNVISNLILMIVFKNISHEVIFISVKIMVALIIMFYLGMIGTLLILKWKQWRKKLTYYLEDLNNENEKLHRFRIAYGIKGCLAFICFVFSLIMLYVYTVGKLFIAVFFHLTGIYFLLQINGRFVKKVLKRNEKRYYQKLLVWTDLVSEYRMNGNIIYSIYAVNLLVVLVFGGLLASDYHSDSVYFGIEIILAVVGVAIILEGQTIILERMLLDIKSEKIQHDILFQLGISVSEYTYFIRNRIKNMFVLPGIVASVMGAVFFMCDYVYQERITVLSDLWSLSMAKYLGAILIFWCLQYFGYLFARKRLLKRNNQFRTEVNL